MKVQFTINVPRWLDLVLVWGVLKYRQLRYGEAFRIIPLTKGLVAIVSPEDYDRLSAYSWYASRCRHTFYAQRSERSKFGFKKQYHLSMHREVLGVFDDKLVDHQNHNGLDNRRSNLRIATPKENGWNRRKTTAFSTSRYKGVCWSKKEHKWHAQIKENGRQTTIGYFDDETEAARAYDTKAKELYGQFAALNFPESHKDRLGDWSFKICYGGFTG